MLVFVVLFFLDGVEQHDGCVNAGVSHVRHVFLSVHVRRAFVCEHTEHHSKCLSSLVAC